MKRNISILVIVISALMLLVGCGSGKPAAPPPPNNSVPQPTQNATPAQETIASASSIDSTIDDIKSAFREGNFQNVYEKATQNDVKTFVKNKPGSEYYTNDGVDIAFESSGEVQVVFLDIKSGSGASTINGFEYVVLDMQANYNGSPTRLLRYIKSEITSGKYTGAYEEYWYIISNWELVLSEKGNTANGGYTGNVESYGINTGKTTEKYTNGYDGVYMNPEDRMPYVAGDEGPDVSHIVW